MITSTNNQIIKDLVKLKQKKYRQESYLVEGDHLVDEALKCGCVELLISTKEIETQENIIYVSDSVMSKLAFTKTPQSIMAKCKKNKHQELIEGQRYLLLDDLQDPGNIGTLIRTALALGIDQVILSQHSVDIYNDKVLRSMQGAHFHIPICTCDLKDAIDYLHHQGVCVIASALENGKDLKEIKKEEKMAFVLGNEGNGMNQDIIDLCDCIAFIPISNIESLNVAIAGSIIMYHFKK